MAHRSRDDYRPNWYVALERAFDVMLRGAGLLIWVWGLAVFLFVAWALWVVMFKQSP